MTARMEVKSLGVEDAFQYFALIKSRYCCEPYIYRYFVGIINEYKHGRIRLAGLVERVRVLFEDHPDLVEKFNLFLPARHRVRPLPQNSSESTHK